MGSHWLPDISNASLNKNLILFKIGHSEQVHNDDPKNNMMMKHCQWPMVRGTKANMAETLTSFKINIYIYISLQCHPVSVKIMTVNDFRGTKSLQKHGF